MMRRLATMLGALASLTACSDWSLVTVAGYSSRGEISASRIEIEAGWALGVLVKGAGDDHTSALFSADDSVLGVSTTDRPHVFVVWGASTGETLVHLELDGDYEAAIPARVIAWTP